MYKILSVNSKILILLIEIISITFITASIEDNWTIPQFNVLQKIYDDCQDKNDFSGCLKGKALLALGKAIEQVCSIYNIYVRLYVQCIWNFTLK